MKRLFILFLVFITMNSCHQNQKDTHLLNPTKYKGHYKIGDSYTVKGITYQPRHYDNYEEVGLASWYGDDFHNKDTANGEIFNKNLITAAHRTLPLPCFVQVQNLENGKELIVKVNDRGPFTADNRIIDLSERAAKTLGFRDNGLAKVKVTYLKNMSQNLINSIPHYKARYEKIAQYQRKKKILNATDGVGYISKLKDPKKAKSIVSKLRNQGLKNVRLVFKNSEYYVYMD